MINYNGTPIHACQNLFKWIRFDEDVEDGDIMDMEFNEEEACRMSHIWCEAHWADAYTSRERRHKWEEFEESVKQQFNTYLQNNFLDNASLLGCEEKWKKCKELGYTDAKTFEDYVVSRVEKYLTPYIAEEWEEIERRENSPYCEYPRPVPHPYPVPEVWEKGVDERGDEKGEEVGEEIAIKLPKEKLGEVEKAVVEKINELGLSVRSKMLLTMYSMEVFLLGEVEVLEKEAIDLEQDGEGMQKVLRTCWEIYDSVSVKKKGTDRKEHYSQAKDWAKMLYDLCKWGKKKYGDTSRETFVTNFRL